MMYPLLLKAPVKDYLWGGTRLKDEFKFESEAEKVAEAWVLSCHKDGACIVRNGEYSGKTLPQVLKIWGEDGIGKKAAAFPYFPLLIKLIDAKDRLSIQVHPDDEYALKNEGEYGKTEMWYIVDCEKNAQLIYGFEHEITKEEFARRIKDNTLTDVCNYVPVKKGDVFFISAGTLHAIGKGILIAEIQQNSNTTYRVSDYGRLGADGKPRPLHIDKALDVTKTQPPKENYGNVGSVSTYPFGKVRQLACCELFNTKLLSLEGMAGLNTEDSFEALLVLDGEAVISYAGGNFRVKKGDSVLVPANFRLSITGNAEIITATV
ncbi:MAG: class I mannose-6-phosphate isomerase [Ruminococcaceae bacterium]|nr:class I mannose-6-phosphate isomerase [Oscillospiraceae bacterium]